MKWSSLLAAIVLSPRHASISMDFVGVAQSGAQSLPPGLLVALVGNSLGHWRAVGTVRVPARVAT